MSIPANAVDRLSQVPARHQHLYELDPRSDGYILNPAGRQLRNYRVALAEAQGAQPPPPRLAKLNPNEWAHLLAAAESAERPYFLKACAAGQIKVVEG